MIALVIEINEMPNDKIKTDISVCHEEGVKPTSIEQKKADMIRAMIAKCDPEDYDLISNTQIDYDKPIRIT